MGIPEVEELCSLLDTFDGDLCLVFPGGAEVCSFFETFPPSLLGITRSLLAQASAGLAPLQPIFDIIETIVAVVDCLQAIPDTIGPPPNPDALRACIPNLLAKIERLLALLPQLSLPLLVVGLLDTIIRMIDGVIHELHAIVDLLERIVTTKGIGNNFLQGIIDCAEGSVASSLSNLERLFNAINSIAELLNKLAQAAKLDFEIPSFAGGLGDDPAAAIAQLEAVTDQLRALRDSIPIGDSLNQQLADAASGAMGG
jgi:hypothetical protein